MIVGFFLVLQGPQSADQPRKLGPGRQHSGRNILSPLTPVSGPFKREAKVEFVTSRVHQINGHRQLYHFWPHLARKWLIASIAAKLEAKCKFYRYEEKYKGKKIISVKLNCTKKETALKFLPKGNCYSVFEFAQNVLLGFSQMSDW